MNLTKIHNNYNLPTKQLILQTLDSLGYEAFFPEKLFYDLMNLCTFHLLNQNHKLAYKTYIQQSDFNKQIINFLNSIQYDFYASFSFTPLELAINILKDLSTRLNFREYENGNFLESEAVENPKFILHDAILFEDIDNDSVYNLNYITELFVYLKIELFDKIINKDIRYKHTLNKTTDFLKSNKSNWVKKDFMYKICTKSLIINDKAGSIEKEEKILVYLEDASSSMHDNKGYIASKVIRQLLLLSDAKVHYYRYVGDQIDFYILNTYEDKLKCFIDKKYYYKSNCNYNNLFKLIVDKYNKGDIIIVTDGEDSMPRNLVTELSMNFIDCSNIINSDMKRLSKLTNGKYIKI